MQSATVRSPGIQTVTTVIWGSPSVSIKDGWTNSHVRTVSGYTGKRPRPLVDHPYSLEIKECQLGESYRWRRWDGGVEEIRVGTPMYRPPSGNHGGLAGPAPGYLEVSPAIHNAAVDNLYSKVRGDVDLSVSIAEMGQLRKMLSATSQVENFTRAFASRFRALKVPASYWLQYVYGVRPLISDVYGAAEQLTRFNVNSSRRFKTGSSTTVRKVPFLFTLYSGTSNTQLPTIGEGRIAKSFGISYRNADSTSLANFSSLNPLSIAWELTPYSFVVDWFYDLGGYLRSLESSLLLGSKFLGGYATELLAYDGKIDYVSKTSDTTHVLQGYVKYRKITRSLLTSTPVPRAPSFKADLGSSRLLSSASLLAQFFRR